MDEGFRENNKARAKLTCKTTSQILNMNIRVRGGRQRLMCEVESACPKRDGVTGMSKAHFS